MLKEKCPVCKKICFSDYRKHIVQKARFEVWQKAIGNYSETPHFDYYFKNTKVDEIKSTMLRNWK